MRATAPRWALAAPRRGPKPPDHYWYHTDPNDDESGHSGPYQLVQAHGPDYAVVVENRGKPVSRGDVDNARLFERADTHGLGPIFGVPQSQLAELIVPPGEERALGVDREHMTRPARHFHDLPR